MNDELIIEPETSPYAATEKERGFEVTGDTFLKAEALRFRGETPNTSASRYNITVEFVSHCFQQRGEDVTVSPMFPAYVLFICLSPWEKLVAYLDNWTLFKADFLAWTDDVNYKAGDDEVDEAGAEIFETWQPGSKVEDPPGEPRAGQ